MAPLPGESYKHFKGNIYRIVTIAEHTETDEILVIYKDKRGKVFSRPLYGEHGFITPLIDNTPRFQLLHEDISATPARRRDFNARRR